MISLSRKVCLLGDYAVGKTSLVRRYIYNLFEDKYHSSVGVKVSRKSLAVPTGDEMADLTMLLWDLAGGEEFDAVRASYLRGAAGGILVCDLAREATLQSLHMYADELRRVSPAARVIVAANKTDLSTSHAGTEKRAAAIAGALGAPLYFTSAKTGDSVEGLFRHFGQLLLS